MLWAGVLVGVALATSGALRTPIGPGAADIADPDVAAVVDGVPIPADRLFAALAGLAVDSNTPLDAERRQRVLDELVAEELLVGRAIELGLVRSAPLARRHLVDAMLDLAGADADTAPPTDAELKAFYAAHPSLLQGDRLLHVDALFFAAEPDGEGRARRAAAALRAGEPPESVRDQLADRPPVEPPAGPVPPATLRHYIGPTATAASEGLTPGEVSDPIRVGRGWRVLRLVSARPAPTRDLDAVRDAVATLIQRERRARAVADYLTALRADADITWDATLLDPATAIPAEHLSRARGPSAEGRTTR